MRIKSIYSLLLLLIVSIPMFSANGVLSVDQVTSAVTLTDDVDYHITGTEPFGVAGSVNIVNTDHAVVVFDNMRPSEVKKILSSIKINGVSANINNSQVRIYGHGSVVYPYASGLKALTVYSKSEFGGDAFSDYETGSVIRLTAATMNNNIRSFKLKRGYMVCMASLSTGQGYNRVFVADESDKEVSTLQPELNGRVSFIRISKWNNTDKRGYAGNDVNRNTLLNTTWCYNWDAGINVWDDREYVTQHHHEGWPGITDVGNNGTSANILGNNEPENTADSREHYNTVDEVLANWPAMMATGKRLGSPAVSGNYNWLYQFIDSIDARGWRCDFIAVHAYWYSDKSSWQSKLSGIHNRTKRPIWITEMNYGANWTGWPGSTTEGNPENYAIEKQHFAPTVDYLNTAPYIERYAVYNAVQDCRMVVNTNDPTLADKNYLTPMGEYYASIETQPGYISGNEYVTTSPRMSPPSSFTYTFNPRTSICTLTWKDNNGEFNDSIFVERRMDTTSPWTRIAVMDRKEVAGSFTYTDEVSTQGSFYYRIHEKTCDGKDSYSPEIVNVINGATGTENIQYGTVTSSTTDESYNYFQYPFDDMPVIVFGSPTSKNVDIKPVEHVISSYKLNNKYAYFKFNYFPWTLSGYQTFDKGAESSSYLVAKKGNGTIGGLNYEAGYIHDADGAELSVKNDTVDFTFDKPFLDAPVVFITPRYSSSPYPYMWRVWNVTNTGFRAILQRQKGVSEAYPGFTGQRVAYFAIDKGVTKADGKQYNVGASTITFKNQGSLYKVEYGDELTTPMFIGQLQSFNRKVAGLLRTGTSGPASKFCYVRFVPDSSDVDNRTMTTQNPIVEQVGWLTISDASDISAIYDINGPASGNVKVKCDGDLLRVSDAEATTVSLFGYNGMKMLGAEMRDGYVEIDISSLSAGIYIVRTNASHSDRFIKR